MLKSHLRFIDFVLRIRRANVMSKFPFYQSGLVHAIQWCYGMMISIYVHVFISAGDHVDDNDYNAGDYDNIDDDDDNNGIYRNIYMNTLLCVFI